MTDHEVTEPQEVSKEAEDADHRVAGIRRYARRGLWLAAGLFIVTALIGGTAAVTTPDHLKHPFWSLLCILLIAASATLFLAWVAVEAVTAALASTKADLKVLRSFVWFHGWGSAASLFDPDAAEPPAPVTRIRNGTPALHGPPRRTVAR